MRRQTSHRAKRFLSPLPQLHALHIVARHFNVPSTTLGTDAANSLEICGDAGFEPVELDEEDRLGIPRITRGVNGILHDANGGTIHELEGRRNDSRCDNRGCYVRCLIRYIN